jgi:hypothetical protein
MQTDQAQFRSNLNGFKSRITGLTTVMTDEDRIHQDDFVREYVQDLDPLGVVELRLARNIALDNWRLLRIKTVEENLFAYGLAQPTKAFTNDRLEVENAIGHAWTFLNHHKAINSLSLYESRLNRTVEKNLNLFMKCQTKRQQRQPQAQPAQVHEIHLQTAGATAQEKAA